MNPFHFKLLLASHFICLTLSNPQQPEINDQFVTTTTTTTTTTTEVPEEVTEIINITITEKSDVEAVVTERLKEHRKSDVKTVVTEQTTEHRKYFNPYNEVVDVNVKRNIIVTIYEILTKPIENFIKSPKVTFVLRNVGTCLVNGAMEIISYYFPAPLIPLIASAAGMVIPFEPVVMLKERMPVTSYRRAFRKAMNSFLTTFEGYKNDIYDDDPYMTRRFNRRFMNDISEEKKTE